jgi:hypothetical protein
MIQSSILPKLLAKENITIQHGNYHTAWFDVEKRVLGLPMWKDMGKDVYDLLVGHEVSHALHTPFEGWHDSPEKLEGAPRSYLNVVEDARIERFIKNIYPGLVGPMARGYKVLHQEGFFGDVDKLEWDEVKLIDKLNIKAKLDHLAEVPLDSEEQVFLDRMMTTQTFEEVVQLAKDILDYTKENQPELLEPQPLPESNEDEGIQEGEDNLPQGHDDMDPQEGLQEEETVSEDSDSADGEESDDCKEDNKNSSEGNEDETPSADDDFEGDALNPTISEQPTYSEEDVSKTDQALRRSESRLLDTDDNGESQAVLINEVKKDLRKKVVIDYQTLSKARAKIEDSDSSKYNGYSEYVKSTKKAVNFAVREFEQRKAAYQYTRAQTAKTGRIDVNKLWSYKTSEDIFSQVTRLADAKNHGMIMLVDFSGSMCNSMPYVMDQLLHLVMFCKSVNIPFDVYGFTSTNPNIKDESTYNSDGDLHLNGLSMPLICSSSLKKSDYENAIKHMYGRKTNNYYWDSLCSYEEYGSTPLDQALIVSHHLVKEFKIKHGVQKMNFITFTDGDSNGISAIQDRRLEDKKMDTNGYSAGYKAIIDGKLTDLGRRYNSTKNLLESLGKRYNTKTIGFFMADDSAHWRDRLYNMRRDMLKGEYDWEDNDNFKKEAAKEYRRNKCVSKQNVFGYDQYYLLKGGKQLSAEDEEFETFGTETDAQLRNAFKKHSKSKKLNKVLMTSFGKEVA